MTSVSSFRRGVLSKPSSLTSTTSSNKRKGKSRRLRAQEARWAAKSGPVVIVRAASPKDAAP